jgi:hypothetical protein
VSVAAAVLALAPRLYWPLDDATGPAASDASGNGNPGVYGGAFSLHQGGPEASTFSTLLYGTGTCKSVGTTPVLAPPLTMMCYVAGVQLVNAHTAILDNTDPSFAVRGHAWNWTTGGLGASAIEVIRPSVGITALAGVITNSQWHHMAFSVSGAGAWKNYIDGNLVGSGAGMTSNNCIAGDKFGTGANGDIYYMAHAALFNTQLSDANVASVPAANTTPVPPDNLQVITNADLAAILAALNSILASVRKVY